jgi:translation initiation factor IF-2
MKTLAEIRKEGKVMTYLRPDSKSQVTIEYSDEGVPQRIDTIVVSTQHDEFDADDERMLAKIKDDVINILIPRVKAQIKSEKVSLKIIGTGTGNVSMTDVKSAAAGMAVIVGFDIGCDSGAQGQARHDSVRISSFRIIYELIDFVKKCMLDLLPPEYTEKIMGHATIKAVYDIGKVRKIAGSQMLDGSLIAKEKYRILRNKQQI